MIDYYLSVTTEADMALALEQAGIATVIYKESLAAVSDGSLVASLDAAECDDAFNVSLNGKNYRAIDGDWYEVVEVPVVGSVSGAHLDVIGTWFDYDPETETSTARPGWHFNVRSVEPIEWPASVTQYQPVSPWRVWG